MKIIIILKETEGDLRAPLCVHNVRALSIISLTSESVKSPFSNLLVYFVESEGGRPIKPEKEGERKKIRKTKFSASVVCPNEI